MKLHKLTVALPEGEAPTEFRLFAAGVNDSEKGPIVFDEAAAESVMAAFRAHGVDVMLDLEHLSLDSESRSYDPDARGWAKLEVRNGELWAVDVKWTADGAQRLKERRQRYVSPAFAVDKSGRVLKVVNVAITALPATHRAQPLIAASRHCMNPEIIKKALDAIEAGDSESAMALLKGMIAEAASGEPAEGGEETALSEGEKDEEVVATSDADEDEVALSEASDEDEEKTETATRSAGKGVDVKLAKDVQKLSSEVAKLKKSNEDLERRQLLAARPDIAPELRKTLSSEPVATVKKILSAIPKPKTPKLAAAAQVQATRGETQDQPVSRLSVEDKRALDLKMGLIETAPAVVNEGNVQKLGVLLPKGAK